MLATDGKPLHVDLPVPELPVGSDQEALYVVDTARAGKLCLRDCEEDEMAHRLILNVVMVAMALCAGTCDAFSQTGGYTYAELMKLKPAQREPVFMSLAPGERATIMKQHLEGWLNVHRPDLSGRQIAAVTEAIAFVTPELYRLPPDPVVRERQSALAQRLACALGDDLSGTLMDFQHEPKRLDRTWRQAAHNWVDWLVNCVVR